MNAIRRLALPLPAALILVLAMGAGGVFGATAQAREGSSGASGSTGATGAPAAGLVASVSACHSDPSSANRYAIFASQMTAIPGSRTMAVEFILQERTAKAAAFTVVDATGFGTWVSSQPGVGIFTYNHEVTGLPAPAAFRVLVHARWLDRRHRVIHRELIVSPVCLQPLLEPDLAIGQPLQRTAGPHGTFVYSVPVRNDGTLAAGPFAVALSVNGIALPEVTVAGLGPDSTQLVQFSGPSCAAGSSIVATADPGGAIAEPPNPARSHTFPCAR